MELDSSQSLEEVQEEGDIQVLAKNKNVDFVHFSDLEISSSPSSTEIRFLEQVKECQHHLYCMEKLFFSLQNISDSGKEREKESSSNHTGDTQSDNRLKSNKINLDQLIRENDEAVKLQKDDSVKPLEKLLIKVQIKTENSEEIFDPMTFLIQIPSDILNPLRNNTSSKHILLQHSVRKIFRFGKKRQLSSLFHKVFRKRKEVSRTSKQKKSSDKDQNLDSAEKNSEEEESNCIHSLKSNYQTFESHKKAQNYCNSGMIHGCSTSSKLNEHIALETEQAGKSTYIFPMTYNFDKGIEKSCLTIHHEITQKSISSTHPPSVNNTTNTQLENESCVTHESALDYINEEKILETGKALPPLEKVTEYLIEALSKTTECLNNLKFIRLSNVGEHSIQEAEKVNPKDHQKSINPRKPFQNSTRMNKSWHQSNPESPERNEQQISKRQSSKLSVCSSLHSVTSEGEIYDKPITPKPMRQCQGSLRCHSPSRLKYLVCQSERDIVHDKRVIKKYER